MNCKAVVGSDEQTRCQSLFVWTFNGADSPADRWPPHRHEDHAFNRCLTESNSVPASLCVVIVVVVAGGGSFELLLLLLVNGDDCGGGGGGGCRGYGG